MPIITAECKAFAENYEKNKTVLEQDLQLLRDWLKTQKHLPQVKDGLLLHFFHSCFYDLKNTKDCIEAYFVLRTNSPDIFKNRDITNPEFAAAMKSVCLVMLPEPEDNGYVILYNGLRDPNPAKFKYLEANKLAFMAFDVGLEKYPPCEGVILLVNMQGTRLGHLAKLVLSVAKRSIQYQQEGNPIRMKAIHIINVVSWIDKLLALIKPFMKKELLELLHFHTNDLESLYEYIPKKCLPSDLGGSQKSLDELQAESVELLKSMRPFFSEHDALVVDETKRENQNKKKTVKPDTIRLNTFEID